MRFDIQTVLATESALCLLLALMLWLTNTHVQSVRGVRRISISFLATAFGIAAFLLRGFTPLWLNVPLANALYSTSNLLLYAGVAALLQGRHRTRVMIATACLLTASLAYVSAPGQTVLRLTVITVTDFLLRAPLLALLFRHRKRGIKVQLLAGCTAAFMLADLVRTSATLHFGTPSDVFEYTFVQSAYIAFSLLMNVALGVLCVALVYRESVLAVEKRARRDPLTQVLNRLGVEERLLAEMERFRLTGVSVSTALVDIDNFKTFNDCDGHAAGDDVLRRVTAAITQNLRPVDACGRLGGDEFLLLFPGLNVQETGAICERIRMTVAAIAPYPQAGIAPSVSIGIAVAARNDTMETLLERTDRGLYSAKHAGKNRIRAYASAERASGTRKTGFTLIDGSRSRSSRAAAS